MNFDDEAAAPIVIIQQKPQASWEEILDSNLSQRPQSKENIFEPLIDHDLLSVGNNDFEKISTGQLLGNGRSALEME